MANQKLLDPAVGVKQLWVDNGDGTFSLQVSSSGGGGGGAVTVADGADVTEGAIADAIVAAGAVGTVSAKLRRVTQGLEDLKTQTTTLPISGNLTDGSGVIATGGTSQQLFAINANRKYLLVQNVSIHDLWLNFTGNATNTGGSILLAGGTNTTDGNPPGGSFVMNGSFVSPEKVTVMGGTTNQSFVAKQG